MKLNVEVQTSPVHTDLVSALGWNRANELFTCSDDHTIHRWNSTGQPEGKVCGLEAFVTDMHWYPVSSKGQQGNATDIFAVACSDGTFKIISGRGRVEKYTEAHTGAVTSLRWNYEGSALATAGEDGSVKIWSRNGMLRSSLVQIDSPVYCVTWAPDSAQVLFSCNSNISIKSLQSNAQTLEWKAHKGVVLSVDWSPMNMLIVSGGEDCRYKVWDSFGRLLYQSSVLDHVVTSVAWCPTGDLFAVGAYNTLWLCDAMGWPHSKAKPQVGSVAISWSADGTILAGAGGTGSVAFGEVVDITLEDGRTRVTVCGDHLIRVIDMLSETAEELDFRDRVIKTSLGFGHLVVATTSQCYIYSVNNFNTPHIFDLKSTVHLVLQCERNFLLVDSFAGILIFTYEGRQVCNPKFQGIRTEFLNQTMVSLSNDTLAVLDRAGGRKIHLLDTAQGKPVCQPVTHVLDINDVALSQTGNAQNRQLIFIDCNNHLYITPVHKQRLVKLCNMVDSAIWHGTTDMLAAIVDQKLAVWYYPNTTFVDKEILPRTKFVKNDSDFGKAGKIQSFTLAQCSIRQNDGTEVTVGVSPYPLVLYHHVSQNQWEKAIRLCRFVKDDCIWACLAMMALEARELHTAEIAFAAILEIDRLQFVLHMKEIPTQEGRNAELALYKRQPEEAEKILVQGGLIYRAIKLHIKLFNWGKAIALATQHSQFMDVVLFYRQKYLQSMGQVETLPEFINYNEQIELNEEAIKAKIEEERRKEAARPGAKPYM
ncbi:hypothetical protein BSKO_06553 [Bryopsis sp. KO-2023]|nr:hypothetical protein BSKO_06553 [Bryopsis sp. KO-2023]